MYKAKVGKIIKVYPWGLRRNNIYLFIKENLYLLIVLNPHGKSSGYISRLFLSEGCPVLYMESILPSEVGYLKPNKKHTDNIYEAFIM